MKNKKFLSALISSQLVFCGVLNITPKTIANTTSERIKDVACTENTAFVGDLLCKFTKYMLTAAIVTVVAEEGLALCREQVCSCAFSYQSLKNADLIIDGAEEYYKKTKKQKPNEEPDMRSWCKTRQGFAQVQINTVSVPGLYFYNDYYYFLTGSQGLKLGRVLNDAISFASTFWDTLTEATLLGIESAFQKAKNYLGRGERTTSE